VAAAWKQSREEAVWEEEGKWERVSSGDAHIRRIRVARVDFLMQLRKRTELSM
jgi:hypothetical protein